jgi:hypothetical protein
VVSAAGAIVKPIILGHFLAVSFLSRLFAGVPSHLPRVEHGSGHVGFVVDKSVLGRFSPRTSVSIAWVAQRIRSLVSVFWS